MKRKKPRPDPKAVLQRLANELVNAALEAGVPGLEEGTVLSSGPAPYRRLDCDGRALAYIRVRPRKRAVRVDVTGLWQAPRSSRLRLPNAGGAASLLLRSEVEVYEAVRFLAATVERTRRAEQSAAERARAKEVLRTGALGDARRARRASSGRGRGVDAEAG